MKRKSDFTLVELAIIIGIFTVFALIFIGGSDSHAAGIFSDSIRGTYCVLSTARERAHRSSCINNLKQIGIALELYSISNDGCLPAGPAFAGKDVLLTERDFHTAGGRAGGFELLRYNDCLTDYKVYVCPTSSVEEGKGADSLSWSKAGSGSGKPNVSYAYQPGLVNGDSNKTGRPASGVCADLTGDAGVDANDGKPNHLKFGNILYLDGHVRGFDGSGWFSPERAGYPSYRVGAPIMVTNTLRDPRTGKAY